MTATIVGSPRRPGRRSYLPDPRLVLAAAHWQVAGAGRPGACRRRASALAL